MLDVAEPAPEVLVEGDPRLAARCAPVGALDARAQAEAGALMAALTAFRARHGFGRGIAAPQLGFARRILALDLGAGPFPLYDPEITWRSDDTFELWDDCFSVPDKLVRVRRHRSISVRYRDARFRPRHWERLPPELAELLQHEIDHLDGVLMTERAVGADALRPAAERAGLVDAARSSHRLSPARIAEAAARIDPVFRDSPQFVCEPLSELLGCRLTLKVETLNPIRSFKGRGAEYALARLMEGGVHGPIVCASAGNFGQAFAYACRKRGLALTVYAARTANPLKIERMRALGAEVRLEGDDFDGAKEAAKAYARRSGALMVEDGLLAEVSEGAGTIARELLARGDAYDAVLVPLGDGALLNGMARWFKAASPATRMLGVCAEGAPTMADAFARGPGAEPRASVGLGTIADGIAVKHAVPESLADMHGQVDDVLRVSDLHMLEAMRLLHRHLGLVIEPSGAVGLAAIVAAPERYAGLEVATVLTGANVAPAQLAEWFGVQESP